VRIARSPSVQAGFTIVELMITLLVVAIMLRIAMPAFATWIGNVQLRGSAESVINGLNLARAEALRRNARVLFTMAGDDGGATAWSICQVAAGGTTCDTNLPVIQVRDGGEESGRARAGATTTVALAESGAVATALSPGEGMPASVIFDGRGRPLVAEGWANTVRIDVRNTSLPADEERRMVVLLGASGGARMCDPLTSAGDPRAC
jgi:type IV fimbrial biogenesis protein FimT